MACEHYINNQCHLVVEWQPKRYITEAFCLSTCGIDGPDEETKALLIEWAKAKQKASEIQETLKEKQRQKRLAELPKGFQLAKNLMEHLQQIHKHYQKTGRIKIDDEWFNARIEVCRNCPDKMMVIDNDGVMRCKHKNCGCYLDNPKGRPLLGGKAEYEALRCELGHWDNIDKAHGKRI
ncbi:MAG: hypothetical protein DRP08_04825 [Candidatus Aenigmatarchaeota archaeon]|nr:MAG: hypothetical protein DRP08_04825 [Candidatus Aenigmarchaeota archaeon]